MSEHDPAEQELTERGDSGLDLEDFYETAIEDADGVTEDPTPGDADGEDDDSITDIDDDDGDPD